MRLIFRLLLSTALVFFLLVAVAYGPSSGGSGSSSPFLVATPPPQDSETQQQHFDVKSASSKASPRSNLSGHFQLSSAPNKSSRSSSLGSVSLLTERDQLLRRQGTISKGIRDGSLEVARCFSTNFLSWLPSYLLNLRRVMKSSEDKEVNVGSLGVGLGYHLGVCLTFLAPAPTHLIQDGKDGPPSWSAKFQSPLNLIPEIVGYHADTKTPDETCRDKGIASACCDCEGFLSFDAGELLAVWKEEKKSKNRKRTTGVRQTKITYLSQKIGGTDAQDDGQWLKGFFSSSSVVSSASLEVDSSGGGFPGLTLQEASTVTELFGGPRYFDLFFAFNLEILRSLDTTSSSLDVGSVISKLSGSVVVLPFLPISTFGGTLLDSIASKTTEWSCYVPLTIIKNGKAPQRGTHPKWPRYAKFAGQEDGKRLGLGKDHTIFVTCVSMLAEELDEAKQSRSETRYNLISHFEGGIISHEEEGLTPSSSTCQVSGFLSKPSKYTGRFKTVLDNEIAAASAESRTVTAKKAKEVALIVKKEDMINDQGSRKMSFYAKKWATLQWYQRRQAGLIPNTGRMSIQSIGLFQPASCPDDVGLWLPRWIETTMTRKVREDRGKEYPGLLKNPSEEGLTLVDVGANKGYTIATWAALLSAIAPYERDSSSPLDEEDPSISLKRMKSSHVLAELASFVTSQGVSGENMCGACCDCEELIDFFSAEERRKRGTPKLSTKSPHQIFGFEPQEVNFDILKNFYGLHPSRSGPENWSDATLYEGSLFQDGSSFLTVAPYAVSATGRGFVYFGSEAKGSEVGKIQAAAPAGSSGQSGGKSKRVPTTSLSAFFEDYLSSSSVEAQDTYSKQQGKKKRSNLFIDLLMTDTEGFDTLAFQGAEEVLFKQSRVGIYIMELWAQAAENEAMLEKLDKEYNFECYLPLMKRRIASTASSSRHLSSSSSSGGFNINRFLKFEDFQDLRLLGYTHNDPLRGWMNAFCIHRVYNPELIHYIESIRREPTEVNQKSRSKFGRHGACGAEIHGYNPVMKKFSKDSSSSRKERGEAAESVKQWILKKQRGL